MNVLNPVLMPALGALAILALDLLGRTERAGIARRRWRGSGSSRSRS